MPNFIKKNFFKHGIKKSISRKCTQGSILLDAFTINMCFITRHVINGEKSKHFSQCQISTVGRLTILLAAGILIIDHQFMEIYALI